MAEKLTLDQCREGRLLSRLPEGQYRLEYNDSTHLGPNDWVRLATLEVSGTPAVLANDEDEQFFTFKRDIGEAPNGQNEADRERRRRVIEDTLALALGRIGLLAPTVSQELLKEVERIRMGDGVVIVPDTNALHNGAVHWLLRVLGRSSVWLLPLSASLTSVQQRDANIKSMVGKKKPGNIVQALRSRGLVNGALGLLQRHRGRSQVVEIDHSLLRYLRPAAKEGADPDQSDVIEDRLIIEAIHGVLRAMRSRTARRVVTSDVNLARVLEAEGVQVLFVPTIVMSDSSVDCIRYDALARGFCGAPISSVLWELTHAFGSVRLTRNDVPTATLECYWAGKTPDEWSGETLGCTFTDLAGAEGDLPAPTGAEGEGDKHAPASADVPDDAEIAAEGAAIPPDTAAESSASPAKRTPVTEVPGDAATPAVAELGVSFPEDGRRMNARTGERASADSGSDDRAGTHRTKRNQVAVPSYEAVNRQAPIAKEAKTQAITTVLPRASFLQMLRLLGVVRKYGSQTADEASRRIGGGITADTVRRAFEILRRTGLLEQDQQRFRATSDSQILENAIIGDDLDAASAIMLRFAPYRALVEALRDLGRMRREDAHGILSERLGTIGTYEAERLPRYLTLLGQAWTYGDFFVHGGERLPDRDAGEAFANAFDATAVGDVAKVIDLLPRFCEISGMSPWAAKRQLERIVAERLLPEYRFEPSAGGKPVSRDEVLAGALDALTTRPVVIDRLHLGERPVFVVGKKAR